MNNFSETEISAIRLEGELTQDHLLWDEVISWRTRCFQVLGKETHPLVLTGLSAVWALGASREPRTHRASTVTCNRIRTPQNPFMKIEERALTADEYWISQSVGVTRPLRTVTDVLKMNQEIGWEPIARTLMDMYSLSAAEIIASIENKNYVPFKNKALQRVYQLER